ncbi:DCBD1 protein, partial [Ciconia maguari]|nr:DCBD1 protein [Ciconia maguari]
VTPWGPGARACPRGAPVLSMAPSLLAGPYCRNAVPATPLLVLGLRSPRGLLGCNCGGTGSKAGVRRGFGRARALTPCPAVCFSVYCPAGCKDIDGDIWGNPSQGYRDTSVLCKAAVHAGVIADELGGQVTLSREKGITLYESAFANGLHSKRGSLSEKRLIFHRACGDALEVAAFNASSWWHEVDALGQDRAWAA